MARTDITILKNSINSVDYDEIYGRKNRFEKSKYFLNAL